MTITPEEIARLREALEIDTEPFLLYRHNLSGMLDEIERLQDGASAVRTMLARSPESGMRRGPICGRRWRCCEPTR